MVNTKSYNCRICGFKNSEKPWGNDWKSPSFSFCPCCWVEFWYQDCTLKGIYNYRNIWISSWLKWEKSELKSIDWDFKKQISDIPEEYQGTSYLG